MEKKDIDERGVMIACMMKGLVTTTQQMHTSIWIELYFIRQLLMDVINSSPELQKTWTDELISGAMEKAAMQLQKDFENGARLQEGMKKEMDPENV